VMIVDLKWSRIEGQNETIITLTDSGPRWHQAAWSGDLYKEPVTFRG
jgi:hypothetical protein